jgi:hypothetical protein
VSELAARIAEAVNAIPIVDSHEHLSPQEQRARRHAMGGVVRFSLFPFHETGSTAQPLF